MQNNEIIGELSEPELRELVPQLQSLTEKYKRSETIQKALYRISELSSSLSNLDNLYAEVHKIVADFMTADNFYVAFYDHKHERITFAYFVDERDEQVLKSIPYEKVKNGVTAHILRSGDTMVMTKENVDEIVSKHQLNVLGTAPVDLIGVPLTRDEQVIGAMVVQSYTDSVRYDSEDLEILLFISQQIITAIDRVKHRELTESLIEERTQQLLEINTALEDEIQERMRMEKLQKALFQISELSANAENDIEVFYPQLHDILKTLINAENFYIAILDNDKKMLSFPYFVGRAEDSVNSRVLKRGLTEYVIRNAEACLVDSKKIEQLAKNDEVEESIAIAMIKRSNSWLGAPLIIENDVKGIIAVQTYGDSEDYTELDLYVMKFVSQHIATAIQRRDAANALVEYNVQLSEKVKERTAELNKSNESLKKQIEQRKEIELKLIHDAHHDALTSLPNRVMFNNRLELAIASKKRHKDHKYALLFVDLDRFKNINDTLGHHAGDQFLIEVAERINGCKRSHDLLARLGGDEFVVLVDKFQDIEDVEAIADRIVNELALPYTIDEKEVFSGASVGIAEITEDYHHPDDALRDADAAMYQAKNLGRNRYILFNISMRNQLIESINSEQLFREAFKNNEFVFSISPVQSLTDDSVLYYECVMNWPKHPKYNKPEEFWELANKCNLNYAINQNLLEEAISILKTWQNDPIKSSNRLGLSLTTEHLLQEKAFERLVDQIIESSIDPQKLVIELSESALHKYTKILPPLLKRLQEIGISLVLENFASQSASLNHLFKFDFEYIKLSADLVNSFGMSDKYYSLVKSVVLIANELDIGVIAEGVDEESIVHELLEVGCHYAQGEEITRQLS